MPDKAPSLDVTREGLAAIGFLGSPLFRRIQDNPLACVVITGTNGKGSTAATLEALCLSAGERTGLYTSPHLEKINERVRIDGIDVDDSVFLAAFNYVWSRTQHLKLSHFEWLTLIAIEILSSGRFAKPVERLILEVGLGGTWDCTNAVPHGMAVIASLALDHENLLGRTLHEIAENKFGIVSNGCLVVHTPFPAEAQAIMEQVRTRTQSRWIEAVPARSYCATKGRDPVPFIEILWGVAELNLAGERGAINTALALTVFAQLGYDPGSHLKALKKVRWPGRMEKLSHPDCLAPIYLSGDHNPAGIQSLLQMLPSYPREHLHILVGIGKDKDCQGMLAPLSKIKNSSLYLTETSFRGRTLEEYGDWLDRARGAWKVPTQALTQIMGQAQPYDMVLVTGSLYLVGDLRRELVSS